MLPDAAAAICQSASSSNSSFSFSSTEPKYSVISCGLKFFKLNCKHLDRIVIGSFCGSVVAKRNLTCGGGSSKVFSKALKL